MQQKFFAKIAKRRSNFSKECTYKILSFYKCMYTSRNLELYNDCRFYFLYAAKTPDVKSVSFIGSQYK